MAYDKKYGIWWLNGVSLQMELVCRYRFKRQIWYFLTQKVIGTVFTNKIKVIIENYNLLKIISICIRKWFSVVGWKR